VTENFADFARLLEQRARREDAGVPVLFVHTSAFPRGGAYPGRLAARLHVWATANPDPYVGPHWL
jgi:hypothetical protein